MTDAFTLLKQWKLFDAFLAVYDNIGIQSGITYMILASMMSVVIYMKTRSLPLLGLTWMLLGGSMMSFVSPMIAPYVFGFVVVGFAVAVYGTFKGG